MHPPLKIPVHFRLPTWIPLRCFRGGNGQVKVAVDPPEGSTTVRRVTVRVRRASNPVYVEVGWDLAMK